MSYGTDCRSAVNLEREELDQEEYQEEYHRSRNPLGLHGRTEVTQKPFSVS